MASSLRTFNTRLLSGGGILKFAFTRRFCRQPSNRVSPLQFKAHVDYLFRFVPETIVIANSSFTGPDHHDSRRIGGGVFIEPSLIVTSAHLVGRVCTSYESKKAEKNDRFEHSTVVHRSQFATTIFVGSAIGNLEAEPLAVNFGSDVAVLKVVTPDYEKTTSPQICSMAKFRPRKGDLLAVLVQPHLLDIDDNYERRWASVAGNVRAIGEKTFKAKAPWPIHSDSPWIEFDDYHGYRDKDGRLTWSSDYTFNTKEEYIGSVVKYTGSPVLDMDGEVVGIWSWVVGGKGKLPPFPVVFAAPLSQIRDVVDYAKTKKPDDPIVMDKWIEG